MRVYMKVHIRGCKKIHIKVYMKIMLALYPMKIWNITSKFAGNFPLNFATEVAKKAAFKACIYELH